MSECVVSGCTREGVWLAIDTGKVASPFDGLVCTECGNSIGELTGGRWYIEAMWCVLIEDEWDAETL